MGKNKENKKSIINSEAFPGILLLATTILALILANTQLDKFYNYINFERLSSYVNLVLKEFTFIELLPSFRLI